MPGTGQDSPAASEYLQFGGMAVPEGVMMRAPKRYAVACRAPNGEIVVKSEPIASTWLGRQKWLKKPFLRGTLGMLDTMVLGMKAMRIAADVQTDAQYAAPDEAPQGKPASKTAESLLIAGTIALSFAFGYLVFNLIPNGLAEYLVRLVSGSMEENQHLFATNVVAEVAKLVAIVAYLALIRRIPAIYDVFRYHGAEHKAINAVENGEDLTVEACMRQTRMHPRCGTNFVILVAVISLAIMPWIPRDLLLPSTAGPLLLALSRLPVDLAFLPLIAGVSYEVIRLAGKSRDSKWVEWILKPGLLTQLITTAEPDEKHQEVAIAALQAAMEPV
jgi:uncharacterized protein YqhQ